MGGGGFLLVDLFLLKAHKDSASENTRDIQNKKTRVGHEGNSHAPQRSGESLVAAPAGSSF